MINRIMGSSTINTPFEFSLFLCVSEELHRNGYTVDLEGISLACQDIVSKEEHLYFDYLKGIGVFGEEVKTITLDREKDQFYISYLTQDLKIDLAESPDSSKLLLNLCDINANSIAYYFNPEYMGMSLLEESDTEYYWGIDTILNNYQDFSTEYKILDKRSYLLMHILAFYLVGRVLGTVKLSKNLRFYFDESQSKNVYWYIALYSVKKTLGTVLDCFTLDICIPHSIDLGLIELCEAGIKLGHNGKHYISKSGKDVSTYFTQQEKLKLLDKLGYVQGAILVLYRRSKLSKSNSIGKIGLGDAHFVELLEVVQESPSTIMLNYREYYMYATKEEQSYDWNTSESQAYDNLERMTDTTAIRNQLAMLNDMKYRNPELSYRDCSVCLRDVGIGTYFTRDDDYVLLDIDKYSKSLGTRRITYCGEEIEMYMSNIDFVYWLLCSYNAEFDRVLYKNMYSPDTDLMYDTSEEWVLTHS